MHTSALPAGGAIGGPFNAPGIFSLILGGWLAQPLTSAPIMSSEHNLQNLTVCFDLFIVFGFV
jgi:hypothetical protein